MTRQTVFLYIITHLVTLIPETRLYPLKSKLYRLASLNIDSTARLVSSVRIVGNFKLAIGRNSFIGHDVLITGGNSPITIGDFVDIGPRVCIVNGSHEIDMFNVRSAGRGFSKPIIISDGVWIGAGSTIIGGVTIGKKSVIAAGSVVTHNIPPYVIAAGVPCKPIKKWNDSSGKWIRIDTQVAEKHST